MARKRDGFGLVARETYIKERQNGRTLSNGQNIPAGASARLLHIAALCLVSAAIFVIALSVRLPYLMDVPGFTDETVEVRIGLDVLKGNRPLVDVEPYLGSFFNYLLAGAFIVLGQHGFVARFLVTLLGAATGVLTYFLARSLAGPLVALLAAGLFTTSGAHIVTGHIAWTNCTTPFFVTATMLSLVEAVARSNKGLLLLTGILYGLALQTHPSVIFLAPAFVLYYLFALRMAKDRNAGGRRNGTERRSATLASNDARETGGKKGAQIPDLRTQGLAVSSQVSVLKTEDLMPRTKTPLLTKWPYLAILAALAAYGNVIAYNSQNPEAWLAATARTDYAYVYTPTTDSYVVNLHNLATSLLRAASSSFEGDPTLAAQLALPINILYLCLLLLGIVCSFYLRLWFLLYALAWPIFLMPYFNKDYSFPIAVRYLGYLLPLLSILMALPVTLMIKRFWQQMRPLVVLPAVFYIVLALLPLSNLNGYYTRYLGENATSPTILALQAEIRARYQAKIVSKVVLDPQLDWLFTAPGGRVLRAFDFLLETERIPYRTVAITPDNIRHEMQGIDKPIVLIASPASRQRLGDAFRIVPMEVPSRPYLNRDGYWAYVVHVPKP